MPPLSAHAPLVLIGAALALAVPMAQGVRRLAARRWSAEARWPPVFALGLAMSASAGLAAPDAPRLGASLLLGWSLVALAIVDIRTLRLPDALTLPLILLGLVTTVMVDPEALAAHLIGAAAGYVALAGVALAYRHIRRREGLGLGDAKLLAAAGAWLGWRTLPAVVVIASIAGIAWVLIRSAGRRDVMTPVPIAFGPALALALWSFWTWNLMDI